MLYEIGHIHCKRIKMYPIRIFIQRVKINARSGCLILISASWPTYVVTLKGSNVRRLLAKETKNAFLFNFSQENSFQLFANKKIFHFDFFVSPDSIRESASVLIRRDTRGAFLHFVRCRPSNLSNEGQRSFSISS